MCNKQWKIFPKFKAIICKKMISMMEMLDTPQKLENSST